MAFHVHFIMLLALLLVQGQGMKVKVYLPTLVPKALANNRPSGASGLQTPVSAAEAAASAATTAIDAAKVAAVAANTAATAAASANRAAAAAVNVNVAGRAISSSPAAAVTPASPAATPQRYIRHFFQLAAGISSVMLIKTLCIAGNVMVQLSPLAEVKDWVACGGTGDSDAAPYVAIAFGGCQWCFYGMFAFLVTSRSGFLILVQSNCLGAVLGTYYVATYYRHCKNERSLQSLQKYLSGVASLTLLQVCCLSTLPTDRALFTTGIISSCCSFMSAGSVLVTVPSVIQSNDSSSIPGAFAIASLVSSVVWCLCGYILQDPMVMMPNIFSVLCSAFSLSLKVMYPSAGIAGLASVELEVGESKKGLSQAASKLSVSDVNYAPTECSALNTYLSTPPELSATKPAASKISFKGTGQKLLAAAASLPPRGLAWGGDGTGGTGETF